VAQYFTVGPEDSLLPPEHAGFLLVGGRDESFQLEASHWALGHRWAILQILENQPATRDSHHLSLVDNLLQ